MPKSNEGDSTLYFVPVVGLSVFKPNINGQEPGTLPEQFMAPFTKYCQAYPHRKVWLTKQPTWVSMFMLHFCPTIPNDYSELSNCLRDLSDEQIVILLSNWPSRTTQIAWRNMKKTDTELEAMRLNACWYQGANRV
jgi:hypothetical protein